ncbi:MAG: MarR family transcriptional regulator [Nitrospirae bacterium]|nr:MarR family transcriptional regulator [Nitrospirota bacterium]MBI3351604.1 MarR family transcriptional regulator [Nitrospirota bacterium]
MRAFLYLLTNILKYISLILRYFLEEFLETNRNENPEVCTGALSSFLTLIRASDYLATQLSFRCENQGLTISQFGILETLCRSGAQCQKELGEKIFKSSGNITLVIDNLEKRALVRRERQGEDRRFIRIYLTDEGKKVITEVIPKVSSFIQEEFKVLTREEQKKLFCMCRKLIGLPAQDF